MRWKRFEAVGGLIASFIACMLAACGDSAAEANDPQDQEKIGQETAALANCYAPIQGYASWISVGPGTNYVSASVVGPGFDGSMWIDQESSVYHPGFCFRGECFPGSWTYTISGDLYGEPISIDSACNMTVGPSNVQVSVSSCTEPSGSTTTTITGTDASGNHYTVTLNEQYLG